MKISAWHKQNGDLVEWYDPIKALCNGEYDRVYMSKVFTFTPDYDNQIYAEIILRGGTGYVRNEKSEHHEHKILFEGQWKDASFVGRNEIQIDYDTYSVIYQKDLTADIEHIYPDYGLYGINDTAYGFLTRGCPRGCEFCIVQDKEGRKSIKVADLSEFWKGQKNIKLLDPNLLACTDHMILLRQLVDSKAWIDITQGFDARLLNEKNIELIKLLKIHRIHFAWDNYEDGHIILHKLQMFHDTVKIDTHSMVVYLLTNWNTTFEQDLDRVYKIREIGMSPYVMIYDKHKLPARHKLKQLARWVNNKIIWFANPTMLFEDYVDK